MAIAITMALVLNNHVLMLQNGTEKRPNKEMPKHNITLAIAITMVMELGNHTQRPQNGTEKQRSKEM